LVHVGIELSLHNAEGQRKAVFHLFVAASGKHFLKPCRIQKGVIGSFDRTTPVRIRPEVPQSWANRSTRAKARRLPDCFSMT
jgi:hypothetical protein